MDSLQVVAGLVLLFAGGEGLVRGSAAIADRLNLSTLLVSMVVVGFSTTMPELLVSTTAALKGAPNLALGNVVGSNIANILLILGVSAALTPIACTKSELRRDAFAVLIASLVLVGLSVHGQIDRFSGFLMVTALAAYMSYAYLSERNSRRKQADLRERIEADVGMRAIGLRRALILCGASLLFLATGAHFLVEGATSIAAKFGISNAVIGLSLVAVGTSLPELTIAIVSAYRRHADVVIGNIIGSNLINILGNLGVTAMIVPIPVAGRIADIDVWLMLIVAIALSPAIWSGRRISRVEGAVFLALYGVYMTWLYTVEV